MVKKNFSSNQFLFRDWGGDRDSITHVITVSCTGVSVPGLEFLLVDELDLNRNVHRLGINFMGCFGGLAGLRTAQSLAISDPGFRILFVCAELCSLQLQKEDCRMDNLIANSLFADGAAAMIVGNALIEMICNRTGSAPIKTENCKLAIEKAQCHAIKGSVNRIRWDLCNTGEISTKFPYLAYPGFRVGLEPDIGFLIGQSISGFCQSLLEKVPYSDCIWAVHPGGKAILEVIEKKMELKKNQLEATWHVYENNGNMSSATILFILEEVYKRRKESDLKNVISLAFGPGLAMEGMMFKIC
jgi:predicted naringenin-chalcone synthase